jgi:hypothetical protein
LFPFATFVVIKKRPQFPQFPVLFGRINAFVSKGSSERNSSC